MSRVVGEIEAQKAVAAVAFEVSRIGVEPENAYDFSEGGVQHRRECFTVTIRGPKGSRRVNLHVGGGREPTVIVSGIGRTQTDQRGLTIEDLVKLKRIPTSRRTRWFDVLENPYHIEPQADLRPRVVGECYETL
jgi:hypothetical protein